MPGSSQVPAAKNTMQLDQVENELGTTSLIAVVAEFSPATGVGPG